MHAFPVKCGCYALRSIIPSRQEPAENLHLRNRTTFGDTYEHLQVSLSSIKRGVPARATLCISFKVSKERVQSQLNEKVISKQFTQPPQLQA